MSAVLPQELFLSHSSLDGPFASDLAAMMRRHGIRVWYSQTNILGAQQWQVEIGAALQRCDWFAVILSPQSAESMWVKREVSYALQQNRFDNRIVPIIYQASDFERLSWTLSTFQMVNFAGSFDDGCRDLVRIWGVGYQGPQA
ncbi:MAG: toll/interleukin-1 receptor domain-containing protein [Pyrinomonadaceae bacterium]